MRRWILVVVWSSMFCPLASLEAQRPISIGIAGGVSVPQGDFRDGVNTGWHALGTVALSVPMQPLGVRFDAAHSRFAFSDEGHEEVSSATLNVTYRLPMTNSPVSPYLIAGLGAYHAECSLGPGCDGTIRYGWNSGLGTRLFILGFRSFLEARYHRTDRGGSDVNYFPVTFGIMF